MSRLANLNTSNGANGKPLHSSDDVTANATAESPRPSGNGEHPPLEKVDDTLDLCAQSKAALSHIRALAGGLRRFSTLQGKNARPQTLETMIADAHLLHEICSSNGWMVPNIISLALARLLASFQDDSTRFNASSHRTCAKALDFMRSVLLAGQHRRLAERLPLKVMVIDDDPVSRRAMLMAMNVDSVKVFACCCGEEAIEKLRGEDFDIIFTDIMMPRISGLNLLPLIRDLPRHRRTPVVYVTALSDFHTKARSTASGGCDFVAKPIVPNEIVLKAFSFGLGAFVSEREQQRAAQTADPQATTPVQSSHASAPKPDGHGKPLPHSKPAAVHKLLGVVTIGEGGLIASCNKDALDIFGYEANELSTEKVDKLFPPELQSEEGKHTIHGLHGGNSRVRVGPISLVGRAKDGRLHRISVTLSQSASRGTISSVLLISAPENLKTNQSKHSETMIAQQDGSRLAMIGTQERAAAQRNEQDALREELAASRSISASLEKHQSKLEEELTLLRESNKRLQWQLNEAEGPIRSTAEAGSGSDTAQGDFSALRDEVKSLLQVFKAELELIRRQAATQSSAPAASPANGSTITAASGAVSPETEQVQLRAKLERQEMENRNHKLLQSLLCDHIRKLDPSRA